jgi:hypothetical protein
MSRRLVKASQGAHGKLRNSHSLPCWPAFQTQEFFDNQWLRSYFLNFSQSHPVMNFVNSDSECNVEPE